MRATAQAAQWEDEYDDEYDDSFDAYGGGAADGVADAEGANMQVNELLDLMRPEALMCNGRTACSKQVLALYPASQSGLHSQSLFPRRGCCRVCCPPRCGVCSRLRKGTNT